MPSTILGNPLASGPQQIVSGNYWSGRPLPVGGIQFFWDSISSASGKCYIGLSGGMTMNSGGMFLSGTLGRLDGMPIPMGGGYFLPKMALGFGISGNALQVYAWCDPTSSGVGRLSWEAF